ncbi:hypothetical protein AXG93_486s1000 [Marchantia polymorpha subsp. ruderalis]|uniref:Reverse transcriptase/retrotransposon-derived protein RNase H-like domain-containing protein n=1 Tax=Marchantia polymorpha subsp. ruderalis TaxID=1480154 RepID=A0A176VKV8_MARPO|nr:hypothetical protein AXG93_486s1000 [Marchantia polymorpha subsp. ruderalis]
MLMLSLRRPRKPRAVKLPEVNHVTSEDLGPPKIDVEIGGCYVRKVPVDSGSGVNIMTEDIARCLGFSTFEPTTRVLRGSDYGFQTKRSFDDHHRSMEQGLGRSKTSHTEGIVDPSDCREVQLSPDKSLKVSSKVKGEKLREVQAFLRQYEDVFAWKIEDMKGIPTRESSLSLHPEKCFFFMTSGILLGHRVSSSAIAEDTEKVKVILELEPSTNLRELRAFLGHVGYYRRFIDMYAILAANLTKLLKKDEPYEWGEKQQLAFKALKSKLMTACGNPLFVLVRN